MQPVSPVYVGQLSASVQEVHLASNGSANGTDNGSDNIGSNSTHTISHPFSEPNLRPPQGSKRILDLKELQ